MKKYFSILFLFLCLPVIHFSCNKEKLQVQYVFEFLQWNVAIYPQQNAVQAIEVESERANNLERRLKQDNIRMKDLRAVHIASVRYELTGAGDFNRFSSLETLMAVEGLPQISISAVLPVPQDSSKTLEANILETANLLEHFRKQTITYTTKAVNSVPFQDTLALRTTIFLRIEAEI
jgi:hypothetical protein